MNNFWNYPNRQIPRYNYALLLLRFHLRQPNRYGRNPHSIELLGHSGQGRAIFAYHVFQLRSATLLIGMCWAISTIIESINRVNPLLFLAQGTLTCLTPHFSHFVRGTRQCKYVLNWKKFRWRHVPSIVS